MKLVVTGATGFTGSYLVPMLVEREYKVRCLVRKASNRRVFLLDDIECVEGDLGDFESLKRAFGGRDALVNVASLGFGHAPIILKAALEAGVQRAVFVSTTAIFTRLNASSKSVRVDAEKEIRTSGLRYTILRPTMIYGSSRDRNMSRLIRYLQSCPIIPIIGNGKKLQQPVYVGDVARAIAGCLEYDSTIGKTYNIPGRDPLTFHELIDTICDLLGRSVLKVHLPVLPVVKMMRILEKTGVRLPIKAEQIMRLNEDKAFECKEAIRDFGYAPRTFKEGIILELVEMGYKRRPVLKGE